MIQSLVNGVNYLHNHQIVHTDINSANVLISSNGNLVLSDLGEITTTITEQVLHAERHNVALLAAQICVSSEENTVDIRVLSR